jgi:holo-ACP synthase/triphosphoribosyl-dephospho-CoA synthase
MESILEAREARWARKLELVGAIAGSRGGSEGGREAALAAMTLRMPAGLRLSGQCATTALALHADFSAMLRERGIEIAREEFLIGGDGPESYFTASLPAEGLKRLSAEFERTHPLGALADIDVMDHEGRPLGRAELGMRPRECIVCGGEAAVCCAGRKHSVKAVAERVNELVAAFERQPRASESFIGRAALAAAVWEVSASPKPGLVTPHSAGSHQDMEYATFLASAAALGPWFAEFARLGRAGDGEPEALLPTLREAGKAAERDMFAATEGVNTHKGLIFSLGLLCAAAARASAPRAITAEAAAIATGITARDLGGAAPAPRSSAARLDPPRAETAGERLFRQFGVRGIRGEAEDGFPSVLAIALPALTAGLSRGLAFNDAMVDALLALCASVEDTNVLARAGREGLVIMHEKAALAAAAGGIASPQGRAAIEDMNSALVAQNISPGGCADLLALAVFLCLLNSRPSAD